MAPRQGRPPAHRDGATGLAACGRSTALLARMAGSIFAAREIVVK